MSRAFASADGVEVDLQFGLTTYRNTPHADDWPGSGIACVRLSQIASGGPAVTSG